MLNDTKLASPLVSSSTRGTVAPENHMLLHHHSDFVSSHVAASQY